MSITLTTEMVDHLIEHSGLVDSQIRTHYSGRAMFGKTCLGVVGDGGTLLDLQVAAVDLLPQMVDLNDAEAKEAVRVPRQDSMGLDTIYYWPGITVDDSDDE